MTDADGLRLARPDDYDPIAAVIDDWWGRPVLASLPRLFFDIFHRSSLVLDHGSGPEAFLIGILSPSDAELAYVHFAGVDPRSRRRGQGRVMYETFFSMARSDGRTVVRAVTSPGNNGSIAFHRSLGFTVTGPVRSYHGPGRDRVLFERKL